MSLSRSSRHPWLENVMPFLTSLSVHIAIVLIGVATFTTIKNLPPGTLPSIEGGFVFDRGGIDDGKVNFKDFAGPNNNPENPYGLPTGDPDTPSGLFDPNAKAGSNLNAVLSGVGGDGAAGGTELGLGPESFFRHGESGPGRGPGTGPGGSEDGIRIPFGTQTGGALFGSPTTGNRKLARSIAYVCDGSGSMMNKMGTLKLELQRSIDALRLSQSFSVIFFQEGRPAVLKEQLLRASPENKRRAYDFLADISTQGSTEVLAGIEIAFKQRPELIVLLTDGDFADNEAVLNRIRQLNRDRSAQINTIAFTNRNDTDQQFLSVLQTIARENRGTFRHVREEDMQ